MARKRKIPQEFLDFKSNVEKTGLKATVEYLEYNKMWVASVRNDKLCIWHNNGNPKEIELEKFWESKAWKTYEKSIQTSK